MTPKKIYAYIYVFFLDVLAATWLALLASVLVQISALLANHRITLIKAGNNHYFIPLYTK
jgi:hypothetical protein